MYHIPFCFHRAIPIVSPHSSRRGGTFKFLKEVYLTLGYSHAAGLAKQANTRLAKQAKPLSTQGNDDKEEKYCLEAEIARYFAAMLHVTSQDEILISNCLQSEQHQTHSHTITYLAWHAQSGGRDSNAAAGAVCKHRARGAIQAAARTCWKEKLANGGLETVEENKVFRTWGITAGRWHRESRPLCALHATAATP